VRILPKGTDQDEEKYNEPVVSLTSEGCYEQSGRKTSNFVGTVGVAREVSVESETMSSLYHAVKDLEKRLGAAFPDLKPSVTFELPSEHKEEPDQIKLKMSVIKDLARIIPICSHCRRVKNTHDIWEDIEQYITGTLGSHFTHSICPDCEKKYYEDLN
jgi:hypothetical protein